MIVSRFLYNIKGIPVEQIVRYMVVIFYIYIFFTLLICADITYTFYESLSYRNDLILIASIHLVLYVVNIFVLRLLIVRPKFPYTLLPMIFSITLCLFSFIAFIYCSVVQSQIFYMAIQLIAFPIQSITLYIILKLRYKLIHQSKDSFIASGLYETLQYDPTISHIQLSNIHI
jgi:hypothetical protein